MGDTFTHDTARPLYTTPDPPEYDYSSVGKGFMISKHGVNQVDYQVTGVGQRHGTVIMAVNGSYFGSPDGPAIGVSPTPVRSLQEVFASSTGTVEDIGSLPWGPDEDDMEGISGDDAGGYIERTIGDVTVQTPASLLMGRALWLSEAHDMGLPGNEKMWKSMSMQTDLEVATTVGVVPYRGRVEGWMDPVYYSIGPTRAATALAVTAIAHKLMIFCQNHAPGRILDVIRVNFELSDNRQLHGYTRPMRNAG